MTKSKVKTTNKERYHVCQQHDCSTVCGEYTEKQYMIVMSAVLGIVDRHVSLKPKYEKIRMQQHYIDGMWKFPLRPLQQLLEAAEVYEATDDRTKADCNIIRTTAYESKTTGSQISEALDIQLRKAVSEYQMKNKKGKSQTTNAKISIAI